MFKRKRLYKITYQYGGVKTTIVAAKSKEQALKKFKKEDSLSDVLSIEEI
jgi:hypothetical protein